MLLDFAQRRTFSIQRWADTSLWSDAAWLLRRGWKRTALFALLGFAAGYGYTLWSPEEFLSRATVRFIPPQVAESYVTPNVAMQVDQRIFAVMQMLRSRLTATQLIERYGLYPQKRRFYPVADLVGDLQEHLFLNTIAAESGTDKRTVPSIEIIFRYYDATTAQKVVQRIVEMIYEENRRYRSDQSIGTTDFLEQEVQEATEQISELEESLAALPTPGGEPRGYEDLLKVENLHDLERRLTDLEHQMNYVQLDRNLRRAQVTAIEGQLRSVLDQAASRTPEPSLSSERIRAQLEETENRVTELQARYKPGHAERALAEGLMAKLQRSLAEQLESDRKAELSREVEQIESQLNRTRADLAGYEATLQRQTAEESRLREEVASLRAEFAPQVDSENERLNLLREYAIAKDHYASLMKRRRESEMASDMERRGQGETAEMVEPPTMPLRAELPNSYLIRASAALAGGAVGYFLGLLMFLAKPRVRSAGHVAILTDAPVLASVPGTLSHPMVIDVDARAMASLLAAVLLFATGTACVLDKEGARNEAIRKGSAAYAKKDYSSARIYYLRALEYDAKSGEAYLGLSRSLSNIGEIAASFDPLIRAGELMPERADVQEQLAELTYQMYFADPGRPAAVLREVEQLASRLREKWPKRASGHRLMAQVLVERRHLQEAIGLMEATLSGLEDGSIRTQLASVYYQAGERDKAEEHLRKCLEVNPRFSPAYDLLYLELMAQKEPTLAREILARKMEELDDLDTGLQLAAHDEAAGSAAAAQRLLAEMAQRWAKQPEVKARIGDFWLHRSDWASAKFWYESGRDSYPQKRGLYVGRLAELLMAQKNEQAAKHLIEAELQRAPNDGLLQAYQAALNLDGRPADETRKMQARLETLVARMPDSPFVHLHLGRAYLLNGNAVKAAEQIQSAVALDPNYAPGWLALAEARMAMGNAAQAQEHLDALLQRSPGYRPARLLKAQASLALQRPAEAESALSTLVSADAANSDAVLLLSRAKAALGKAGEAVKLLEQAAAAKPNDLRVIQEQARLDIAMNQSQQALTRLRRAEKLPGGNAPEFQALLASVALAAGDSALAVERFRHLTDQNPANLEYRLGYASSLGMTGNPKEAERQFELVQQKSANDVRPWLLYGALMAATSNRAAERNAYEEALKRDPENPFALNNLAFLLARTGTDLQKALMLAERAKRRLPLSWEINDTLAYTYLRLGLPRNAVATLEEIAHNQRGPGLEKTRAVIDQLKRGEVAEVQRVMENGATAHN